MKEQWYEMKYDKEIGCWFVSLAEREELLFCGNWVNLRISENKGIPGRLELAEDWYIIFGTESVKLYLDHKEIYKIQI